MSRGLTPVEKRELADKFLNWLVRMDYRSWDKTYTILLEASEALNEEVYNLWKAVDLLITLGRIERISPNGRQGCRVVSIIPLTLPVPSEAVICKRENCPFLKAIEGVWE